MSATFLRLTLCGMVMAGLAGCGGGSNSGGGGNTGGGNPTTVTYTFTGSTKPTAVATQIGTGAYTQASLSGDTLTVSVPSGETKYAVAYFCPSVTVVSGGSTSISDNNEIIFQRSIEDGLSFSYACGGQSTSPQTGLATLQVDAAAISNGQFVQVGEETQTWSSSPLNFSTEINTGTYDVPVTVSYNNGFSEYAAAVRILRDQTIPGTLNGGSPLVFGAADETVSQPITYKNVPAGFSAPSVEVLYLTANGGLAFLSSDTSTQYQDMPAGSFQSGDYYFFQVQATSNAATSESLQVIDYASSGGAKTITLPEAWSYAGPAATALPTFNLNYPGFAGLSDVGEEAGIRWGAAPGNAIEVLPSTNYLNGSTSVTIPGLSSLTGFLASAPSGSDVGWHAEISQGNPGATTPPSGTLQFVSDSGSYTEP